MLAQNIFYKKIEIYKGGINRKGSNIMIIFESTVPISIFFQDNIGNCVSLILGYFYPCATALKKVALETNVLKLQFLIIF